MKKDRYWLIVPSGVTSGLSSIKHQEHISKALGLETENPDDTADKQEPETMSLDIIFQVINNIYMSAEQKADIASIVSTLMCSSLFKVTPVKNLLLIFKAKTLATKDIENMLYTINVMMEVLGTSLNPTRENRQFFDTYWKALNKQKAKTFLFTYSAIFDKFTANMDMLEETFPQSEVKDELLDRI